MTIIAENTIHEQISYCRLIMIPKYYIKFF